VLDSITLAVRAGIAGHLRICSILSLEHLNLLLIFCLRKGRLWLPECKYLHIKILRVSTLKMRNMQKTAQKVRDPATRADLRVSRTLTEATRNHLA
jgi:hypothetical protein